MALLINKFRAYFLTTLLGRTGTVKEGPVGIQVLIKYKYPPDKQQEAIDMVMKQAEVLSDEWSR